MNLIETERLVLRTWQESDIIPFAEMNRDPEVMEFFPKILSQEETEAFYKRITADLEQNGFGLFAVETKQDQIFIGFIGFARPSFSSYFTPCIEIGWRMDKRFWNMGFATEGAKACLEYGFSKLNFKEIVSFTAKINKRSINVMKRIGMAYAGDFEHPNVAEGHPLRRHVLYKISREDILH
ncbi:MAG: GNAT family N-acetyltransferase [Bacteroidota bacterium]